MTKAKLKYTKNKEFKVPYRTQKGTKYAVLYSEGFRRGNMLLEVTPTIPEYEQMNKPKELFFRYKANVCEVCGAYIPAVKVYQVKSMRNLDVNTEWERL